MKYYYLAMALAVGLVCGFIIGFCLGYEIASRRFLRARPGDTNNGHNGHSKGGQ